MDIYPSPPRLVAVSVLQYHCCNVGVVVSCCIIVVARGVCCSFGVAVSLSQYDCCSVVVTMCFVAAWCCCFMWCFQLFLNTKADLDNGFVLYFEESYTL